MYERERERESLECSTHQTRATCHVEQDGPANHKPSHKCIVIQNVHWNTTFMYITKRILET